MRAILGVKGSGDPSPPVFVGSLFLHRVLGAEDAVRCLRHSVLNPPNSPSHHQSPGVPELVSLSPFWSSPPMFKLFWPELSRLGCLANLWVIILLLIHRPCRQKTASLIRRRETDTDLNLGEEISGMNRTPWRWCWPRTGHQESEDVSLSSPWKSKWRSWWCSLERPRADTHPAHTYPS